METEKEIREYNNQFLMMKVNGATYYSAVGGKTVHITLDYIGAEEESEAELTWNGEPKGDLPIVHIEDARETDMFTVREEILVQEHLEEEVYGWISNTALWDYLEEDLNAITDLSYEICHRLEREIGCREEDILIGYSGVEDLGGNIVKVSSVTGDGFEVYIGSTNPGEIVG